jgi:V-type H+-transporting ATPase proteolipid subunit
MGYSIRQALVYYTLIFLLLLLIVLVLYMLFTGQGDLFNIGEFLIQTNPYNWATLGIGLCMAISVLGAAW